MLGVDAEKVMHLLMEQDAVWLKGAQAENILSLNFHPDQLITQLRQRVLSPDGNRIVQVCKKLDHEWAKAVQAAVIKECGPLRGRAIIAGAMPYASTKHFLTWVPAVSNRVSYSGM